MKTLFALIIAFSILTVVESLTGCVTKMYVSEIIPLRNHKAKFVFMPVDTNKHWVNTPNYENSIDAPDTAFYLKEVVKMNSIGEIIKLKK